MILDENKLEKASNQIDKYRSGELTHVHIAEPDDKHEIEELEDSLERTDKTGVALEEFAA